MSKTLKTLRSALVASIAGLAASSAMAAELDVVNRCPTAEGAVFLGVVERGGSCADCVASLKAGAARFSGRLAFGARATLSAPKSDAPKLFTYVAGRYRHGVEVDRKATVEIVAAEGGECEVRKVEKLASSK